MNAKAGLEAWREKNLSLPAPDELRIMSDGSMEAIRNHIESGWYQLYASFTWDADGRPVEGTTEEEAIGQPDYYSRSPTLLDEDALTQTLAGCM